MFTVLFLYEESNHSLSHSLSHVAVVLIGNFCVFVFFFHSVFVCAFPFKTYIQYIYIYNAPTAIKCDAL